MPSSSIKSCMNRFSSMSKLLSMQKAEHSCACVFARLGISPRLLPAVVSAYFIGNWNIFLHVLEMSFVVPGPWPAEYGLRILLLIFSISSLSIQMVHLGYCPRR